MLLRSTSSERADDPARRGGAFAVLRGGALLATGQPLSEIAYACGFRDYAHFARKLRHRFGDAPGAYARPDQTGGDRTVRAGTGESALSAHDARAQAA